MTDKTPRLLALLRELRNDTGPDGCYAEALDYALAHLSACGDAVAWAELCRAPNGSIYWQTSVPADQLPLGRYYPSPLPEPEVRAVIEAAVSQVLWSFRCQHTVDANGDHSLLVDKLTPEADATIERGQVEVSSLIGDLTATVTDAIRTAPRILDYLRGQQP
jgi:hypothetical protein